MDEKEVVKTSSKLISLARLNRQETSLLTSSSSAEKEARTEVAEAKAAEEREEAVRRMHSNSCSKLPPSKPLSRSCFSNLLRPLSKPLNPSLDFPINGNPLLSPKSPLAPLIRDTTPSPPVFRLECHSPPPSPTLTQDQSPPSLSLKRINGPFLLPLPAPTKGITPHSMPLST
jgi:hypothetical protein